MATRYSDPHYSNLDLSDSIGQLGSFLSAVLAELLVQIAELDLREAYRVDGAFSMESWLCTRLGLSYATAQEYVRVARALTSLPRCAQALAEGRFSWDQIRALTRFARPEEDEALAAQASGKSAAALGGCLRSVAGPRTPIHPTKQASWGPRMRPACARTFCCSSRAYCTNTRAPVLGGPGAFGPPGRPISRRHSSTASWGGRPAGLAGSAGRRPRTSTIAGACAGGCPTTAASGSRRACPPPMAPWWPRLWSGCPTSCLPSGRPTTECSSRRRPVTPTPWSRSPPAGWLRTQTPTGPVWSCTSMPARWLAETAAPSSKRARPSASTSPAGWLATAALSWWPRVSGARSASAAPDAPSRPG